MFNLNGSKGRQQLSTDPNATLPQNPAKKHIAGVPADDNGNSVIEARIAEIEAQRQVFACKNPDFDMKVEMQNPDFVNYVWGSKLSVEDAYYLVHREELLEQARLEGMQMALKRSNRIPENGTSKNRPVIAKKNPKDLSDKEVDAIIARAKNGETITF